MTDKNPFAAARLLVRRTTMLLTPMVYSLVNAAPAWAAGGTAVGAIWLGISDSADVPIGSYGLSLNNGSVTDPSAVPSALSMHWLYGFYKSIIGYAIWLPDYAYSLRWLKIISGPVEFMGTQLTAMVHSPAVLLAVGFAATCFIAINVALGKVGRAAAQATVAILLACLAATVGSKPISEAVGPSGFLAMGRDIAAESVSELSGKSLNGDQAVKEMTQQLADHYVRTPTLVWNFGADLDAAPYNCGAVWSAAITTGPIDKVKDAVEKGCPHGEELHDYAMSDPDSRKTVAFSSLLFAPTMLFVHGCQSILAIVLGIATIIWLIVAIVALVTGWIPGVNQTLAIKAGLGAVVCFAGMTAMFALIGITGLLVSALFSAVGGDIAVAMPMVVVLIVALLVGIWFVRKSIVEHRKRTVQAVQRFTDGGSESGHAQAQATDPTTAQRVSRLTRGAVKTGVKYGISVVAPEAAPYLAAGDQLQHRVNAKRLKGDKRTSSRKSPPPSPSDITPTAYEPAATAGVAPRFTTPNQAPAPGPSTSTVAAAESAYPARRSGSSAANPAPQQRRALTKPSAGPSSRPNRAGPRTPGPGALDGSAPDVSVGGEARQQSTLLSGATTTRSGRSAAAASSSQDHPPETERPTPGIHPAIAHLARQIAAYQESTEEPDAAAVLESRGDVRGQRMARSKQR